MKIPIALIALLLMLAVVDARAPKVGDDVLIMVNGPILLAYDGIIKDISNGMICLNCTHAKAGDNLLFEGQPIDLCIGIGQISELIFGN